MRDVLPDECALRNIILGEFNRISRHHGYGVIEPPIIESTALFARSLGDGSDVVSKEMYTFAPPRTLSTGTSDDGVSLTLRPEGTAGVMRALLTSGLIRSLPQKLAYSGPMFRHERPQKGRHRQFTQAGVEAVGCDHPLTDVEVIGMAHELLTSVLDGSRLRVKLLLNSLGDAQSMRDYSGALSTYFSAHRGELSPESAARLERGSPLRILDSKAACDAPLIAGAPAITDFLTKAALARFGEVKRGLRWGGIGYQVAPTLVRGLDYYRHTIFEFVAEPMTQAAPAPNNGDAGASDPLSPTTAESGGGPGQLGTVLAGGRYDGLCESLGGPAGIPGIGWAAGVERLTLLTHRTPPSAAPHVVVLPLTSSGSGAGKPGDAASAPTRGSDGASASLDAAVQQTSNAVAAVFRRHGLSAVVQHAGSGRGPKKQMAVSASAFQAEEEYRAHCSVETYHA